MKVFGLLLAVCSVACIGVIDNEGMDAAGATSGSMVTQGTTGSSVLATSGGSSGTAGQSGSGGASAGDAGEAKD
jgi:hypothetical protein